MTTTLFAASKGGSGKTTTAVNISVALAHAGRDVVHLDADPQKSGKRWSDRRANLHGDKPTVHIAQAQGDIYRVIKDLATRYTDVVVETPAGITPALTSALRAVDTVVIPLRPTQVDLETLTQTLREVQLARAAGNDKLVAYVLLTCAPTNAMSREIADAKKALAELAGLAELCPYVIGDRKAYRDTLADGLGVIESRNSTAKAEIQLVAQYLFNKSN